MDIRVVDVVDSDDERYLYKCISPMPFRKWKRRSEYLKSAVSGGLRKKILIVNGDAVGQIEYAPAGVSGYPIYGEKLVVMNCIWVLRRAKGHGFGRLLIKNMVESEPWASSFATIGLENHWSPWMRRGQMEFKPVDSMEVESLYKREGHRFMIYLMWLPVKSGASMPRWNKEEMCKGVYFCIAHPLYHPQSVRERYIFRMLTKRIH